MALVWPHKPQCLSSPEFPQIPWGRPTSLHLTVLLWLCCFLIPPDWVLFVIYLQSGFRPGICWQASLSEKTLYQKDTGGSQDQREAGGLGAEVGRHQLAWKAVSWEAQHGLSVGAWSTSWCGCVGRISITCSSIRVLLAQEWMFQKRGSSEPSLNYVWIWLLWFLQREVGVGEGKDGLSPELCSMRAHQRLSKELLCNGREGRSKVGGLKNDTVILSRW